MPEIPAGPESEEPAVEQGYSPESLAREVLGQSPISIEQVLVSGRGFAPPYVHRVGTEQYVVYLKHGPASEIGGRFALEAWAYGRCRARGVLSPQVVAVSAAEDDVEFVATIGLRGAALWQQPSIGSEDLRTVLRAAGEQLRAMHEIEVDGYGPITSPGTGSHSHWCPFVEVAQTEGLPYFVDCGVLTSSEADDIQRMLADATPYIRSDVPSRLLHADLEGDHVFADGGDFTGFIDFEKMQGGDPIYDLARFAWWDPQMLCDLVDGYGRDRINDDDLNIRMPAYLIVNHIAQTLLARGIGDPGAAAGARKFLDAARHRDFATLV